LGSDWRRAIRPLLALSLGFVVVYAPWPLRNLATFGHAYPLGGRIDRFSRPVENYQGSWAFLRAISKDWRPMTQLTTCYYTLACAVTVDDFLAVDLLDAAERQQLQVVLDRRQRQGHSLAVSAGFMALADARRRARPLEVELILPLKRWRAMWIAD